jgi:hypothetical protein
MRKGLLALAVAAALTASAGGVAAGASLAADNASRGMHDQMTTMDMSSMDMSSMAAMHTPEMDEMHSRMLDQMPAETRAACDELHTQMGAATAGTNPAEHFAHHDR